MSLIDWEATGESLWSCLFNGALCLVIISLIFAIPSFIKGTIKDIIYSYCGFNMEQRKDANFLLDVASRIAGWIKK